MPLKTLANRYEFKKKIGQGGMGSVYRAFDKKLNRYVALKILSIDKDNTDFNVYKDDEVDIKRFINEARIAAKLIHPHIIQIFDVGIRKDTYFIAMEYIEGTNFRDYCKKRIEVKRNRYRAKIGRIYPSFDEIMEYLTIIKKVTSAISLAHKNNIIHRDLKPENILLQREIKDDDTIIYEPKIADFGLAKQTHIKSRLTKSGFIVGTPEFMSPEQVAGKDVDKRSDIFSLGIMMYEAFTNVSPFHGKSSIEVMDNIATKTPAKLSRFNPNIDETLNTIVMKCLERDKKHRYQSAEELLTDIDLYLEGEEIVSAPPNIIIRTKRKFMKNMYINSITIILGLIILGFCGHIFANYYIRKNKIDKYIGLAKTEEENFNYIKAYEYYRAASRLMPDDEKLYLKAQANKSKYQDMQFKAEKEKRDKAIAYFSKGKISFDKVNFIIRQKKEINWHPRLLNAISNFKKAVETDDAYAEAYFYLGLAYKLEGRLDDALASFEYAFSNRLNYTEPIIESCKLLFNKYKNISRPIITGFDDKTNDVILHFLRDTDKLKAEQVAIVNKLKKLTHIISKYSLQKEYKYYCLGVISYVEGDIEDAEDYFTKSITEWETSCAYLERSDCFFTKGEYEKTFDDINNALKIGEYEFVALYHLSKYYIVLDKHDLALKHINKAVQMAPDWFNLYLMRGSLSAYYINDYENAEKDFKKALTLAPNNRVVKYATANFYFKNEKFDQAVSIINEAIKHNAKDLDFLELKLNILVKLGNSKAVSTLIKQILEINPKSDIANFFTYMPFIELGDDEKAKEALENYLEMFPTGKYVRDAKELLNRLEK